MPKPVMERLRKHFQDIADSMDSHKGASEIFPNNPDAGGSREDILADFLKSYLPKRCDVIKGGFIFDSQGAESKQIDLIVTHDLTLQFKQFEKSFNCIEGCFAAISVKTKLDKKSMQDALANIASIPPMTDLRFRRSSDYKLASEEFQMMPVRIIFAFDSISVDKLAKYSDEFYEQHQIPWYRKPDMIIVNNRFFVLYTGNRTLQTISGNEIPPDTFSVMNHDTFTGAGGLLMMLSRIQAVANLLPYIFFDFSNYADAIMGSRKPL